MSTAGKIKVVVDTNIVISSAVCVDGNPAKLFEMILLEKIENYTTEEIINEIKEVMARPKITQRLSLLEKGFIVNNFEKFSKKIKPSVNLNEIKEDPDDNKFLECAVSAAANYIISGDEHLLKLKEFRGIKILKPVDFIKLITKNSTKQQYL